MSAPIFNPSKRRKADSNCIICSENCGEIRKYTLDRWQSLEKRALQWKGILLLTFLFLDLPTVIYIQSGAKLGEAGRRLHPPEAQGRQLT